MASVASDEIQAAEDADAGIPPADLKIILLGDSAVGKSKLVERYLLDAYNPRQRSTFALTLYRHEEEVDDVDVPASCESAAREGCSGSGNGGAAAHTGALTGAAAPPRKRKVAVDFWDTAGQERFASLHASYYFKAHACILVFDVTRKVTYTNLVAWYNELRTFCPHIPCICIANKIDCNYSLTTKAFAFPAKHGLPFFFVSAADGTNVVAIFQEAARLAWAYKVKGARDFVAEVLELIDDKSLGDFGRALYGPSSPKNAGASAAAVLLGDGGAAVVSVSEGASTVAVAISDGGTEKPQTALEGVDWTGDRTEKQGELPLQAGSGSRLSRLILK